MYFAKNAAELISWCATKTHNDNLRLVLFQYRDIWLSAHKTDRGYATTDTILSSVFKHILEISSELPLLNAPMIFPNGLIAMLFQSPPDQSVKETLNSAIEVKLAQHHVPENDYRFVETVLGNGKLSLETVVADAVATLELHPIATDRWLSSSPGNSTYAEFCKAQEVPADPNQHLFLLFQPIFDGKMGLLGVEALIRWQKGKGQQAHTPDKFLPALELLEVMQRLDGWVLGEAVRHLSTWHEQYPEKKFKLSINITPKFIASRDLIQRLKKFPDHLLQRLEIEILEGYSLKEAGLTTAHLSELLDLGIGIALDDFGTGESNYSSLRYLPISSDGSGKTRPNCKIKIDQQFVLEMPERGCQYTDYVCQTIVSIGRYKGITVAAEGIECHRIFKELKNLGVDVFQGYLVDKPMTRQDFENKWLKGKQLPRVF